MHMDASVGWRVVMTCHVEVVWCTGGALVGMVIADRWLLHRLLRCWPAAGAACPLPHPPLCPALLRLKLWWLKLWWRRQLRW